MSKSKLEETDPTAIPHCQFCICCCVTAQIRATVTGTGPHVIKMAHSVCGIIIALIVLCILEIRGSISPQRSVSSIFALLPFNFSFQDIFIREYDGSQSFAIFDSGNVFSTKNIEFGLVSPVELVPGDAAIIVLPWITKGKRSFADLNSQGASELSNILVSPSWPILAFAVSMLNCCRIFDHRVLLSQAQLESFGMTSLYLSPRLFSTIAPNAFFKFTVRRSNNLHALCGFPGSSNISGSTLFNDSWSRPTLMFVKVPNGNSRGNVTIWISTLTNYTGIGDGCKLLNYCSGHGLCDYCTETCFCSDGYGSARDKVVVLEANLLPDCSTSQLNSEYVVAFFALSSSSSFCFRSMP